MQAYHVMARRWRPRTLSEVVGHDWAVQALKYGLNHAKPHHAYLLTGTRGIGKTTLARILARGLNCINGPTDTPCGVCTHCQEMDHGSSVDFIEVDAASKTKVEETRALLDAVHYAPAQFRYRIYLIDEVHMLSGHSFNALLKTLEEPPAHACFILATTARNKVPETVRSRCFPVSLQPLPPATIAAYLGVQLAKEGVGYEQEALLPLAEAGFGSLRDTLTILEAVLAYGQGRVTVAAVRGFIGKPDTAMIADIVAALAVGSAADLWQAVNAAWQRGMLPDQLLYAVAAALKDLAWFQLLQTTGETQTQHQWTYPELHTQYATWGNRLSVQTVHQWFEMVMRCSLDAASHADPRAIVEMGLAGILTVYAVPMQSPALEPIERVVPLERGGSEKQPAERVPLAPLVQLEKSLPLSVPVDGQQWASHTVPKLLHAEALTAFDKNILQHSVLRESVTCDPEGATWTLGVAQRAHAVFRLAPHEHALMAKRLVAVLQTQGYPNLRTIRWSLLTAEEELEVLTPFAYQVQQEQAKVLAQRIEAENHPNIQALQRQFSDLQWEPLVSPVAGSEQNRIE